MEVLVYDTYKDKYEESIKQIELYKKIINEYENKISELDRKISIARKIIIKLTEND